MTQPDLDKVRLAAAVRVECEEAGHPGCQFPQCACPSTPNRVRAVIAAWEAGAPKPHKLQEEYSALESERNELRVLQAERLETIRIGRAHAYAEGLSRGFDAGFGISGEGWNGEMKPDHCQDSYYQARKATEIAALKREPRP